MHKASRDRPVLFKAPSKEASADPQNILRVRKEHVVKSSIFHCFVVNKDHLGPALILVAFYQQSRQWHCELRLAFTAYREQQEGGFMRDVRWFTEWKLSSLLLRFTCSLILFCDSDLEVGKEDRPSETRWEAEWILWIWMFMVSEYEPVWFKVDFSISQCSYDISCVSQGSMLTANIQFPLEDQ